MKPILLFLPVLVFTLPLKAQYRQDTDSLLPERVKVYNTKPIFNIPIIAVGFVANYYGIKKLKSKPGLDSAVAVNLSPMDVNAFDRGAAMQDPAVAKHNMLMSDVVLNAAILSPPCFTL